MYRKVNRFSQLLEQAVCSVNEVLKKDIIAGLKSISEQPLVYGFVEMALESYDKTFIEVITEYSEPQLISSVQGAEDNDDGTDDSEFYNPAKKFDGDIYIKKNTTTYMNKEYYKVYITDPEIMKTLLSKTLLHHDKKTVDFMDRVCKALDIPSVYERIK